MSNMVENRSNLLQFSIENLGCFSCAAKMEQQIRLLPGVRRASLDFATANLHLELEPDVAAAELTGKIQAIVQSLEQDACLLSEADRHGYDGDHQVLPGTAAGRTARLPAWIGHLPWRRLSRFAFGLLPLSAALLLDQAGVPSLLLYLAAYLILGYDVLWAAVRRIGKRQLFDEHFLMSLATLGALAIGEYPEAVAVMLFYQVGDIFQNLAVNHSRRSIQALLAIQPDQAVLLVGQEQQIVEPSVVRAGDRLLIRPGDRVPLDGRILTGQSSLDTSALTGESQPRSVESGDEILAGSVNGSGLLTVEVLRPVSESAVSRILNLVETAAARKAPAEQFITRFAAVYTPVMVGLALALALLPPLVLRQPLDTWVYNALILLVISCPCALVLSVPLGYFAGLGAASGQGILVKGGQYLDLLAAVRIMAWDKTGTLTRGDFEISRIVAAEAGQETQVLELAALAESYSSHPLAHSVIRAWQDRKKAPLDQKRITAYHDLAGRGVSAIIDGQAVILGNRRLMADEAVVLPSGQAADGRANRGDDSAGTWLYLALDGRYAGAVLLEDQVRPEAAAAIAGLKTLGIRRHALLSGDRLANVVRAAQQAGIDEYQAELLPEQKVAAIESLAGDQTARQTIAYVGDGINDAPVLARADLGIAMGGASDAALERADVVIVSSDLEKLPTALRIARKTSRIVRQNIVLALGLKALVLILAFAGIGGIWQAVFADVGVAVLAVLNSLRVLRR